MACVYAFDLIDTLLKGDQHFRMFGGEYLVRVPVCLTACVVAMATPSRRYHAAFVIGSLIYELSFIVRMFNTLD